MSEEDRWIHRGKHMNCGTCMWYVPKAPLPGGPDSDVNAIAEPLLGRCRRHAPTMSGWPVMFLTDWCGDHKIDENKV